jgi:hypothetical protein
MASFPVLVVSASFHINRKWRQIVEEDFANQNQTPTSQDFLRSAYKWGGITFLSLLFVSAVLSAASFVGQGGMEYFWTSLYAFFFFAIITLGGGLPLFYAAVRESKDQERFAIYPPRLPNLLSILTGEEKAPRGFRNRINFWGDVPALGWGLWVMQVWFVNHYFYSCRIDHIQFFGGALGDWLCLLTVSLVMLAFFLFAVFFAGIPRRRYWGTIFLGVSVLLIDTGFHFTHLMLSETLPHGTIWFAYGFSFWYLLCFTLLGVGGLWVFRRR